MQMRLIAAESDRAYNGGPLNGKYYQHSSFTPLEAGLVQEGTYFLMEEYTFRISVLYFKLSSFCGQVMRWTQYFPSPGQLNLLLVHHCHMGC
jgi:hypothetical protein